MSPPAPERPATRGSRRPGTLRLGTFAGSEVFVTSSWFVVAALISFVLAPRVETIQPGLGPWKYVVGVAFAIVLYGAVLLHEGSHAVVARRYGHPVHSITLSFIGGRTEVGAEAQTPRQEFWIAVVGPLTSLAVGGVALAVLLVSPEGLLVLAVEALAVSNLLLGLLNLVPALPLDGGRVLKAGIWQVTGSSVRGVIVAAWGGRVAAVLLVLYPFVSGPVLGRRIETTSLLLAIVIAGFLWTSASAELANARLRHRIGTVVARELLRTSLGVPSDLPLSEAERRASEHGVRALVTLDPRGTAVGIVDQSALEATPTERRPWVPVSSVARTLAPDAYLPLDIDGQTLLRAIRTAPAPAYLLVHPDGRVAGVLDLHDVDRVVRGH